MLKWFYHLWTTRIVWSQSLLRRAPWYLASAAWPSTGQPERCKGIGKSFWVCPAEFPSWKQNGMLQFRVSYQLITNLPWPFNVDQNCRPLPYFIFCTQPKNFLVAKRLALRQSTNNICFKCSVWIRTGSLTVPYFIADWNKARRNLRDWFSNTVSIGKSIT